MLYKKGIPAEKFAPLQVVFPSHSFGSQSKEAERCGQMLSGCAGEVQFSRYFCNTSANHLTQWSVRTAGDANASPFPSAFPTLALISEELKFFFMDGIHGGHIFLITTALHVLLGTDCKARHPPSQQQPSQTCLGVSGIQRCSNQQADAD